MRLAVSFKGAAGASLRGLAANLDAQLAVAMNKAIRIVELDLKNVSFSAKPGPPRGLLRPGGVGGLAAPTGRTRATIQGRLFRRGRDFVGVIGSPVKWLRVHEEGKVIEGNPLLFLPTVAGGVIAVRQVKIPARRPFRKSLERKRAQIRAIVGHGVTVAVTGLKPTRA